MVLLWLLIFHDDDNNHNNNSNNTNRAWNNAKLVTEYIMVEIMTVAIQDNYNNDWNNDDRRENNYHGRTIIGNSVNDIHLMVYTANDVYGLW